MRVNKWTHGIWLVLLCHGCIEPYEPEIEESRELMVIDGRLNDQAGNQIIRISTSSPYKNPEFRPVSGCVVRVEDDEGTGVTFLENDPGIYQWELEPDFLQVGKAYKLHVLSPDDLIYESEYDTLFACPPIDTLSYRLEVQGSSDPDVNYYGIRFYADVKGTQEQSRFYLWSFEETWEYLAYYNIQYIWNGSVFQDHTPQLHGYKICYLSEALEQIQVGSSSLMGANEIRQQPLHFVSNTTPRLQEKYSLLVMQHSLSYPAYLYWQKMKAQSGNTGGLFETQPSRSKGNISNINNPEEKVLGNFFVSQVQKKRITVSEDFDFPIVGFYCPLDTATSLEDFQVDYPYIMYSLSFMGRGPPYAYSYRECHDCTYRGGVTTKPDYWDD